MAVSPSVRIRLFRFRGARRSRDHYGDPLLDRLGGLLRRFLDSTLCALLLPRSGMKNAIRKLPIH
jgi:hypothetical protein